MAILKLPRLKVVSDGRHTRLFDAEGNEVLKGAVRAVRWEHSAGKLAQVVIELLPVGVEVEGEVRELTAEEAERLAVEHAANVDIRPQPQALPRYYVHP